MPSHYKKKKSSSPKSYTAKSGAKFTGKSKPVDFTALPEIDMRQYLVPDAPANPKLPMAEDITTRVAESPTVYKPQSTPPKTAIPKMTPEMQKWARSAPVKPDLGDFQDFRQYTDAMMDFEARHGTQPTLPPRRVPAPPKQSAGQKLFNTIARLFGRGGGSRAVLPAMAGGAAGAAAFGLPELAFAQDVGAPTVTPQQYGGTNIAPTFWRGFKPNPFMTIGSYGEPTQGSVGAVPGVAGFDYFPAGGGSVPNIGTVPGQMGAPMQLPQVDPGAYDRALGMLQLGEPFNLQGIRNAGQFEQSKMITPEMRSMQGR